MAGRWRDWVRNGHRLVTKAESTTASTGSNGSCVHQQSFLSKRSSRHCYALPGISLLARPNPPHAPENIKVLQSGVDQLVLSDDARLKSINNSMDAPPHLLLTDRTGVFLPSVNLVSLWGPMYQSGIEGENREQQDGITTTMVAIIRTRSRNSVVAGIT